MVAAHSGGAIGSRDAGESRDFIEDAIDEALFAAVVKGVGHIEIFADHRAGGHVGAGATAQLASTDTASVVTGSGSGLGNKTIKAYHITWGTAINEIDASDVPLADAGSYYAGTTVEAALQEIGAGTVAGYLRTSGSAVGIPSAGPYSANGANAATRRSASVMTYVDASASRCAAS
jgi:hypothetical protein